MSRKKRNSSYSQVGVGMTPKQMKRRKPLNMDLLKVIDPLTKNQEKLYDFFEEDSNIIAAGVAGTGKTFVVLYNALCDVFDDRTPYEKIYLVRSLVPSRAIGFTPGTHEDKAALYEIPYKNMVKEMFEVDDEASEEMLYANLKAQGTISFWSTSFIRGTTFNNSIIVVDEFENLSGHEIDSIITRVGKNCKIVFCGDFNQTDLTNQYEKKGSKDIMKVLYAMPSMKIVEFGLDDIVRSGLVREYLTTKISMSVD